MAEKIIVVGTNALTEVQWPAYTNHCQFWFRLGRSYPDYRFIFSCPPRMSIDRMRNMTAKVAIECNAEYVLFLDDDVLVNPNYGLKQLLDCKADIAAGRVCVRGYPFDYMVFKNVKKDPDHMIICNKLPKKGIYQCDAVGFSFALIKVDLIKRLEEPWFVTGLNNTEDIYFCRRARIVDPKCKIAVNCECYCNHILWSETIGEENRKAYKKFVEATNPGIKVKPGPENPVDRGSEYLNMIVDVMGKKNET